MTRSIYLLLTLLMGATSCINTIGDLPVNHDKQLTLNAICSTRADKHKLNLSYTQPQEPTLPANGVVRLLIDGQPAEQVDVKRGNAILTHRFKTGQRVQIEATADGHTLQSDEIIVPEPLVIEKIDTSYVRLARQDILINSQENLANFLRLQIKVRKPQSDPAQTHWYRILVKQYYLSLADGKRTYTSTHIQYNHDVALTDGQVGDAATDEFELIPRFENDFGLFTDHYFTEGTYTFVIDVETNPYEDNNHLQGEVEKYLEVSVYSMSEKQYYYLKAFTDTMNDDSEDPFLEHPVIPTNMKQGLGLFDVVSISTHNLLLEFMKFPD